MQIDAAKGFVEEDCHLRLEDLRGRVDQLVELAGDDVALGGVEVDGAEDGGEERELQRRDAVGGA